MKNKLNIFYIISLIILTIILFSIFGNNIYSPYSDIGRELYIPQQLNNGEVLYKDIYNVYSPLGYWLTAIIIKFFGDNIRTFLNIGLFTSLLSIIPIYLITNNYSNKHIAFITTLDLIIVCTFYPSISNWITPYSYGIIFALCSILWAIYTLIKFIDTDNNNYFIISSFLCGLSICFKYEYICFVLILFIVAGIKKLDTKVVLKSVMWLFLVPFICLLTLFIQGCTIENLIIAIQNMIKLTKSEYVNYFYNYAGIKPSLGITKQVIPITYVCIILLLIKVIQKDFKLSILLLTSVLLSIKSIGGISFEIYGTFFYPLLFIGLVAFVYNKPNIIKSIFIWIFCTILCITNLRNNIDEANQLTKLETSKGIIKIEPIYKDTTIKLLNYLKEHTTENNRILIFAEGSFINYLTNTKSDNFLYYLIPPNTDVFSKEFIINRINNKDIDYIICSNIQYPWYNELSFISGWGKTYLKELDYKEKTIIGKNFQFTIYKR